MAEYAQKARQRRQPPPQLSSEEIKDRYERLMIPEAAVGTPEIHPSEIEIVHVLGDGAYGTVYKGRCRSNEVAVKKLHTQNLSQDELDNFRREVEILSHLRHPNIVLFLGACSQPGNLMIVTELMKYDLEALLQDEEFQAPLLQRMRMAKDVALGMYWLHANKPPILHRDLNPSNLLVDANGHIKIADYGLSRIRDESPSALANSLARSDAMMMATDVNSDAMDVDAAPLSPAASMEISKKSSAKGTPYYMAPELLRGEPYTEKCDVYSFGIVLWQLLTKEEPYSDFDDMAALTRAVGDLGLRPTIPADTNSSLSDLIQDCWEADPKRRPPFVSIIKRLEQVIIDCAIRDPHANLFWKERFLSKDDVPWPQFINLFGEFIGLTTPGSLPIVHLMSINHIKLRETTIPLDLRCFKAVLLPTSSNSSSFIDSDDAEVNIERFGQVCDWFGPIKSNISILERVRETLKLGWFHGDIDTAEAENRLVGKEPGTFLVRFSTSAPGAFAVSKVSAQGLILHQRISRARDDLGNSWFCIQNQRFSSLVDLIFNCQESHLLLTPCTGSRYYNLFNINAQLPQSGYIDN